jgi:hypothetical protein
MKVATVVLIWNVTLGLATAAPPVIGTVTSGGAFRLNGDTVMTNGTLTEGAVLETENGNLSVRLAGGARLTLSAASRGKLYGDHIVLESGETRLENGVGFHLEALGLTIRPDPGLATGRIELLVSNRVRVAAQTGSFRVLNARGVLVANVAAGSALAFEPQASAAVTHITGTLTRGSGHFLLTDRITRVTVEVTGPGLAAYVGHLVGVTGAWNAGAAPAAGASQVIAATEVQTVGAGAGIEVGATPIAMVGGVAARAVGPPIAPPGKPPGRPPGGPPTSPPGRPPGRPPVNPPGLSR